MFIRDVVGEYEAMLRHLFHNSTAGKLEEILSKYVTKRVDLRAAREKVKSPRAAKGRMFG